MPVCCNLQLVLGRIVEMQSFNLIRIIRYSLRNQIKEFQNIMKRKRKPNIMENLNINNIFIDLLFAY